MYVSPFLDSQIVVKFDLNLFYELVAVYNVGYAVGQLVEAPNYKLEVRGFDSRWCHRNI